MTAATYEPQVAQDIRGYETSVLQDMVTWCDEVLAGVRTAASGTITVRAVREVCAQELNDRALREGRDQ